MWLMEQPLTIAFFGVVLVAIFAGGLLQTGRRVLLFAALGVVVLTIGLLLLERSVITPREAVKATLHVIAHDLKRNDIEAVKGHISPGRPKIEKSAERALRLIEIENVDIKNNLKVEVVSERGMEIAEAKFNCVISGRDKRGDFAAAQRIPQFFTVRFRREDDGRWRVRSYEMADPREGIGQ